MTFEQWKAELATELGKVFGDGPEYGALYIKQSGDDCWREMFNDDLTPAEAAGEEAYAAASSL